MVAGPGTASFDDPHDGIVDLGFVSDAQKYALLRGALAFCHPGINEGFSRTIFEAWSCGRPVAVNSYCLSTSVPVERSGGGWCAAAKDEWAQVFHAIDYAGRDTLAAMGARGYDYYLKHATKDSVLSRYEKALALEDLSGLSSLDSALTGYARDDNGKVACLNGHDAARNGKATRSQIWDVMPDLQTLRELQDGRSNILFAGRLEPDSWCDDLVAAFSFLLAMQCDARLNLIDSRPVSEYSRKIQRLVEGHGLLERIRIVTDCTVTQAASYYRAASLFWSLSNVKDDLDGLLDAMWFDVPILAYASEEVKAFLGPAGVLVNDAQDAPHLGALAKTLLHDVDLRGRVLRAQRERRDPAADTVEQWERVS